MLHGISRRSLCAGFGSLALVPAPPAWAASLTRKSDDNCRCSGNGVDRIFDADLQGKGLDGYDTIQPVGIVEGRDYGFEADPAGDRRRTVWFNSSGGLSIGKSAQRVEALTEYFIRPAAHNNTNDVYWMGLSVFYPSSHKLRSGGWCTLATGGFGPPWNGPSPLSLVLFQNRHGRHEIRLGTRDDLVIPFALDEWNNIVMGYRFAYDGWVEVSTSVGVGNVNLSPVLLRGQVRMPYDTMRRGSNDAWWSDPSRAASQVSIGVYGSQPSRASFAFHRIATVAAAALPF